MIVSWPAPTGGWLLPENRALGTTHWANTATPPIVLGEWKPMLVPAPIGCEFYLLKKVWLGEILSDSGRLEWLVDDRSGALTPRGLHRSTPA